MSVKLFFVRHGQSEANLKEVYYNDEKAPLTGLGCAQAAKTGYELKEAGVKFDAIFCSPFKRAVDTCTIALDKAGMRGTLISVDNRLRERDFDGLIGQTITPEHNREIYDYNSSRSLLDGIETLEHLEARARSFLDEIKREYNFGSVLVFSHGIFGLAVRAVVEGRPETNDLYSFDLLKNGEIMVLEI